MFTSAALEVNRHEFEDSQYQARESHAADLTSLLGGDYSNPNYPNRDPNPNIRIDPNPNIIQMDPAPPSRDQIVNNQRRRPLPAPEREQPTVEVPAKPAGCGIWQYTCGSGDCIAGYDVCDGIPQCADSSDESLENCPTTTAKTKPTKAPKVIQPKKVQQNVRPQNMNKWGREGEKMNPNAPPNQPNSPQQQQQQSAFQHRGANGVQLPYPNNVDPRAYGNGYGYPPQQGPPYGYPQQNGYNYGYNPQLPPNYSQDGYNQGYNYNQGQQAYQQQQQAQMQPHQQQGPQQPVNPVTTKAQSTTKIPRLTNKDASDSKKGDLAPTDPDPDVQYKNFLIKDLKAEDFEMETPVAAYFTLIVGSTVCFCVCFIFCCRIKNQKKRGRKRNLASDAGDAGDYLVNGLYL